QAKEKGIEVTVGKMPFAASGRAMAVGETEGFVKTIADKKTRQVLGIHIVGPSASDLISEGALALEMAAFLEDIGMTIHPHPTLGEAVMISANHAMGQAVDIMSRYAVRAGGANQMAERIVVAFVSELRRADGAGSAGYVDVVRTLAQRAEALGGSLTAWGVRMVVFDFAREDVEEAMALATGAAL